MSGQTGRIRCECFTANRADKGSEPFALKLALMAVPPVITAFVRTESLGLSRTLREHLLALCASGALYQNCRLLPIFPEPIANRRGVRVCFCHVIPAPIPLLWVFRHCLSSHLVDPVEIPGCHSLRDMLLWYHGWKRAHCGVRRRSAPEKTVSGALRFGDGPADPTPADGGRP